MTLLEQKNKFFNSLSSLSKEDSTNLKRSFNRNFYDVDNKYLCSFYKVLPYEIKYKEYVWFFCACLTAYQETSNGMKFYDIVRYMSDDNINKRFNGLLRETLGEDTLFLYKLGQMIRMFIEKGYKIDIDSLLSDLLSWNAESGYIQKKWAKEVYSIVSNSEKEEE